MQKPRKMKTPVTLFASIESETHDKLRNTAFYSKRSIADLVRDAIELYLMPQEVKHLVDGALPPDEFVKFWKTPHALLKDQSPEKLWGEGSEGQKRVRDFINSAKSGDTA